MKLKVLLFALALSATGCASLPHGAAHKAHWGYSGAEGPAQWGSLSPEYQTCGTGMNQSPIDLAAPVEADLAPLTLSYAKGGSEVVNNGHTVQVNYQPGSTLTVDGHRFTLKQFHFHAPSENHIGGKSFPMEAHLVHADDAGHLAVVAVMFEEAAANPTLEKVWAKMPAKAGQKNALANAVSVEGILPANRDYYRFNGSLTTPPCSEGVLWLVMKTPVTASAEQIEHFRHTMHHPNNRPVQPLNARAVMK